jgi:hypothetical protein
VRAYPRPRVPARLLVDHIVHASPRIVTGACSTVLGVYVAS